MAGYIMLRQEPKVAWSSSGWMFDWVANFLAENLRDRSVAQIIRARIENNLGDLYLEQNIPSKAHEALMLLASSLVPYSRQNFPANMRDREGALSLLEELAAMARDVLRSSGSG
jgi:hypothetical protein